MYSIIIWKSLIIILFALNMKIKIITQARH